MAKLSTMDLVALGSLCGGIVITIVNKAVTDGTRNGAARLAWLLVGIAFGRYVYGGVVGMLYALDAGEIAARSSRGGSVLFHRAEHPLLFWITFFGLTAAMGMVICITLMCFWKAFKRG